MLLRFWSMRRHSQLSRRFLLPQNPKNSPQNFSNCSQNQNSKFFSTHPQSILEKNFTLFQEHSRNPRRKPGGQGSSSMNLRVVERERERQEDEKLEGKFRVSHCYYYNFFFVFLKKERFWKRIRFLRKYEVCVIRTLMLTCQLRGSGPMGVKEGA